jgi:hypothetical protein
VAPKKIWEHESNLPIFAIKDSEDFKEFLVVRCTREDCPGHSKDGTVRPFLVHKRSWLRPKRSSIKPDVVLRARACPYCFASSRMR